MPKPHARTVKIDPMDRIADALERMASATELQAKSRADYDAMMKKMLDGLVPTLTGAMTKVFGSVSDPFDPPLGGTARKSRQ